MIDLQFAFRQLLKNPGFTAIAGLTLTMPLLAQPHPQPAFNSTNRPNFTAARAFIQEHMVKYSNLFIAVAVARRGEILWEEGFGWADRENRIPANEHTMYYMA